MAQQQQVKPYDYDTVYNSMRLYEDTEAIFKNVREDMTRNYNKTVTSMMWDEKLKQQLEQQGRPANAYNLLRPVLRYLSSLEVGNRKRVVAKPQSNGDAEIARVMTHLITYFHNKAGFDQARTRAFLDSIIARFGMLFVDWSFENDPAGALNINAIDPRRVSFDLGYADQSLKNSQYVFDKNELSIEDIIQKYASDHDEQELQEAILSEASIFFQNDTEKRNKAITSKLRNLFSAVREIATEGTTSTDQREMQQYMNWFNPQTLKFDVLELHEKRTERRMMLLEERTRKFIDITDLVTSEKSNLLFENEKIDSVKKKIGTTAQPFTELITQKWIVTTVPALQLKVQETPYPIQTDHFMFVPVWAYDYHADMSQSQSVVDDLIDPQSDYNKARSTKLELLQRYLSKGWIVEEGAIEGFEEDWTTKNLAPMRRVNQGFFGKVQPEESQTINPDLIRETQEAPQQIEYISGAMGAVRGEQESPSESGKHYIAKKNQIDRNFSYLFGNVDNLNKAVGEITVAYFQEYLDEPRIVRITEDVEQPTDLSINQPTIQQDPETGQVVQKIANDVSAARVDIEIDQTPYGSSAKEIEYMKIMDLLELTANINPQKADSLLNILIRVSDLPYKDELMQNWKQSEQQQAQGQQKVEKIEQMKQTLDLAMKKLGISEQQLENQKAALEVEEQKYQTEEQKSNVDKEVQDLERKIDAILQDREAE